MASKEHLLLSSIGISDYQTMPFEFDGTVVEEDIAPAALVQLFNEQGVTDIDFSAALIARTPEAGTKNDDRLETAFTAADIDYEFVDIDLISDASGIDTIVQTIVDTLRSDRFDETSIVLDISHSFRSLPFVFLLAAMQLEALEAEITLEKIYYSRFAGDPEYDTAAVIDFTHLRTLIQWYSAFETAQRTGTFRGLRLLLEEKREAFFVDADATQPDRDEFSKFVGSFGAAQQELDAGFPLEAGIKTKHALDNLSRLDPASFIGPEGIVLEPLEILLDGFDTDQPTSQKTEYQLDKSELERQASIVRYYTEHERYWIALECGRELFVNRLLYDADETDWLARDTRERITPATGKHTEEATLNDRAVQQLWNQLSDARNQYAHAGFKEDNRPTDEKVVDGLTTLCDEIGSDTFWQLSD